jgi:hypothetical protein
MKFFTKLSLVAGLVTLSALSIGTTYALYGTPDGIGYFYGQQYTCPPPQTKCGSQVLPQNYTTSDPNINPDWPYQASIPDWVNTKSSFEDFIINYNLNSPNPQKHYGALYIIQTMLGGTNHADYVTPDDINTWKASIDNPNVVMVSSTTFNYDHNTFYDSKRTDDVSYQQYSQDVAIVFENLNGDQVYYAVKRLCANPLGFGYMPGLPILASVDGVKIDDSGGGAYGGQCASVPDYLSTSCSTSDINQYPFSDDSAAIVNVSTTPNNYFYSPTVPTARGGSLQEFNVSPGGTPDAGWGLVGYSYCVDEVAAANGQPPCDASTMGFNDYYFTPSTSPSFTHDIHQNQHIHIRWVFHNSSPVLSLDSADCAANINGTAYDPTDPSQSISVLISIDAPRAPGVPSVTVKTDKSHGFTEPITSLDNKPDRYQNGLDHTFYIYALSINGGYPDTLKTITMTGCGQFKLDPAPLGILGPTSEAPTSFTGNNVVKVTYTDWDTSITSKPVVKGFDSNLLTRNGSPLTNPCVPPSTDSLNHDPQSYTDQSYSYCAGISNPAAGDTYCSVITVTPATGIISNKGDVLTPLVSTTNKSCQTITNQPFFKILNSSITTGGKVGSCTSDPGVLASWFNNTVPTNNYGSSAQLGAYALTQIAGFASNQTDSARVPHGLSFANDAIPSTIGSPDATSPHLGGLLTGSNCITALAADPGFGFYKTNASHKINIATLLSSGHNGIYSSTSSENVTVKNPGNKLIPVGQPIAIYVTGDAYITHDIVYNTAGWTANTVPSFVLVATGNIYIDGNVGRLDGSYQAGGKIYTCANGFAAVTATNLYAQCNKQLTVNGSFVATQVNLLRTFGSLRNDSSGTPSCSNSGGSTSTRPTCAAEVFDFSPEQYLAHPAARKPAGGALQYDAITSLPPVL